MQLRNLSFQLLFKQLKTIILSLFCLFFPSFVFAQTNQSSTSPKQTNNNDQFFTELNKAADNSFDISKVDNNYLFNRIGSMINLFIGAIGVLVVLVIIYAGYTWLTAGGNDDQVNKAKRMISQAIMGLAVLLLAYGIVQFAITFIV